MTPAIERSGASPTSSPRRLFAIAVAAAVAGLGITLSFGYADHDPQPHAVRIDVAATPAVRTAVAAGLHRARPGGFEIVGVPDARAALQDVRRQKSAGALIAPSTGAVTVVTAGAASVLAQQVISSALTAVSESMDRRPTALDVAPLPTGDHAGLSSFVFCLGLLLPSVIGGVALFLLGRRLRLWWRVAAAALFAMLTACGATLALDTVLGALTGAGGALIGIGVLGALAFVLFVVALQALVGLPGTGVGAIAFVFVGNALSGGSVPTAFLPDGFRQIAPWVPNNAIVRAVRDAVYFHGHGLGHPLLVLGLWLAVAAIVVATVDLIQLSERRLAPDRAADIYRTPAAVHVGRRLGTRSLQSRP